MGEDPKKVESNRKLLVAAQGEGTGATLKAYFKLSGPGWLQSAITLGGGSLSGALFLGILGGYSLLWLQLVAIIMGVIMLSAISYVTLSTGERPFRAINEHINPVLGWGWLLATCTANMLWCMPQFGLCFAALDNNLLPEGTLDGDSNTHKLVVSAFLLVAAGGVVVLSSKGGSASKLFDIFLKLLVGVIVVCFFGVVVKLTYAGSLDWGVILGGFIPDLSQWSNPTKEIAELVGTTPASVQDHWNGTVVKQQQNVMIGAAATAVGINMTFLLPYSMLARGWDKPFRGLARFDLSTGMAIPYIVVTSCVVLASYSSFHAKADEKLLSADPVEVLDSPDWGGASAIFASRVESEKGEGFIEKQVVASIGQEKFDSLGATDEGMAELDELRQSEIAKEVVLLSEEERKIGSSLVKRNAFRLASSLDPLLGTRTANLVFGIGIFGMGFSTIIILMLINGYAFCEMFNLPQGGAMHVIGCIVAGVCGALWPLVFTGTAKLWLAILVSSFGMILLPIAYFTFFMMMNSKSLMGAEKPTGIRMCIWNVLMGISVLGALVAAGSSIYTKMQDDTAGMVVIGVAVVYIIAVGIGFFLKKKPTEEVA